MEERRIFSSDGMENASILFWRPLSDSLDSKLSPSVREKRIYEFFIPQQLKICRSSISRHVFEIAKS